MKLNQRLILISIVPIILSTLVTAGIIAQFTSEELFDATISKIKALYDLTESQMKNPLNNLDVDALNEIIDNLEKDENILQVLVLFPDGRLFTDGTDDDFNYGKTFDDEFIENAITNDESLIIENNKIRASKPISLDEKIGVLVIDYSTTQIESNIGNSIAGIIGISVIILTIAATIAYRLSLSITNPVLKISKTVDDISKGNLRTKKVESDISEINDLAEGISEMSKKLQDFQNNKIKTERLTAIGELSSRITHDLRNPLNALNMAIAIMKNKSPELVKKHQKYFDMMQDSILRMNHQIEEVLGFIKIRSIHLEVGNFSEILNNVLKSFQLPKNICISVPQTDHSIWCDKILLQNVLANLISNSIHAIDTKEGQIKIEFEEQEKFDKITIEDNGGGIPADSLETIFDPLYTTKLTGTGLGLVSCKNTIEAHNGKIYAENSEKGGAIFTILLPNIKSK